MELPPYRIPTVKGAIIHMWERGVLFLKKAGTIILALSVVIWALSSLPVGVEYGSQESVTGQIGTVLSPIFEPLGFGEWQATVAIIYGFLAKEVWKVRLVPVWYWRGWRGGEASADEAPAETERNRTEEDPGFIAVKQELFTPLICLCLHGFCTSLHYMSVL